MSSASAAIRRVPVTCRHKSAVRLCSIHVHHHRWNHARAMLGLPRVRYGWYAEAHPARRDQVLTRTWQKDVHAHRRLARASASPWSSSWLRSALCIHHYEGAWNANTGNGYYGGLQMDAAFEAAYGAEFERRYGTADRWPPHDQLLAAYRAWRSRGWSPWPSTAAMCGV